MANLVLASKRELKSGSFWHVYRSEDNNKSEEFYFANPLKALRYAFILRSRHGAIIPKGVYSKLMADVKASKPEQSESTAPVESTEQAPAESKAKRTPRKRTAKKANTEPSTESK
ncbi:MAG: hypothetical protein IKX31_05305 [Muribaculaceae bacterium]|nr:hypothetical protein [Muribaculaceae bacterium]MBR5086408.1 hypothetical protein [Muribaculaceae bacterium]